MTTTDIQSEIEDLIEEFELLDDWEQRYRYLIDMGKSLIPLSADERSDINKVKGCVSQVWLVSDVGDDGRVRFRADSDAHIVRGLAALLVRLYSDRTREEILSVDARAVLGQIGLSEHLSPQRSNGLTAMINRIVATARR
jgi:cysteine desulfuration protein SufE